MRSFIAIELPETIKNVLAELQKELKKCGVDVRWVKPGNIHLTLKFLGDIDENQVSNIVDVMSRASESYRAFRLTLSGVGVFPNIRSPRVMWAGFDESDALSGLQSEIEDGTSVLGFKREKRAYAAHLTLGRFKSSSGKLALRDRIELYKGCKLGSLDVSSVALMKSDLSSAGAEYTRLAEIALRNV